MFWYYIYVTSRYNSCLTSLSDFWNSTSNNGVARTLKKYAHQRETILDQAVILFNCATFQNGNFS